MCVANAMRKIIKSNGIEILKSPDRFQAMVMDTIEGSDREMKLLSVCCQRGLLKDAQKIVLLKDMTQIEVIANKMKSKLESEAFMAEDNAVEGVNLILKGLDIDFELVAELPKKNVFEDSQPHIENSPEQDKGDYKKGLYFNETVVTDKRTFLELLKKADDGDKNAMIMIGDCYKKGIIVECNLGLAEYYYRKAIELHSEVAKQKYVELINEGRVRCK